MSSTSRRHNDIDKASDEEVIARYKKSDNTSEVGLLYQRYGHLVLGLCIKYLKNETEAEDAVMSIFSRLIEDLKKHEIKFFKSWLYVYSKNHCLMELRKRQRTLKNELQLKEEIIQLVDFNTPEHLKEKEVAILQLEEAIDSLNEEQKVCIKFFYLEGLSYAEIMARTSYTNNEVKSYIQNGKRNIKLMFEARNERTEDREY